MRVRALHIQHFRAFTDFWFVPNEGVNVITGPNNVGKTSMLEAIRLALDPTIRFGFDEVITRFDFHDQDLEKPVDIRVWLAHDEHETDDVRLDYYDKLTKWQVGDAPARVTPVEAEPMAMPSDLPKHEELVCIRVSAEWDSTAGGAVVEHAVIDEEGVARWRPSLKQRRLIDYRHFGSRRDPVRELSLSPRSSLARNLNEKELLQAFSELLEALEKQRDLVLNLGSVKSLIARLEGLLSRDVLNSIVNEDAGGFTVTFLQEGLTQLRRAATIATTRSSAGSAQATGLPLSYQGHGMQNLLLLAYIADALKGSPGGCIVSFEEPEQNLEPPAARWIFRELIQATASSAPDGVAKSGSGSAVGGQCFITTHSPVLVGEADGAKHLVIMQRRPGTVTVSPQAREEDLAAECTEAPTDAGGIAAVACSRLEPAVRKALERNSLLYSNPLFARHVLLVDGASELGCLPIAFRHFAGGSPGQDPFHLGLEIVNVEGTGNACEHAQTLSAIGKSCHILLDRDCPADSPEMQARIERATKAAGYVSSWSAAPLVPFVEACDLLSLA